MEKGSAPDSQPSAVWPNRIVGHCDVDPAELMANERNWRTHPDRQHEVLRGVLSEVGYVQAVIVNRRTGEEWPEDKRGVPALVDGHLRCEEAIVARQPTVPVTYVNLSPVEETKVLATFDPLGGLAEIDEAKLDHLLREIETGETAIAELLAEIAAEAGLEYGDQADQTPQDPPAELEQHFDILVSCTDEGHQCELLGRFEQQGLKCRALAECSTKSHRARRRD